MKSPYSSKVQAFPLQLVLIVPFVLQIFAAVGLVGYLSFKNGQKAVNDLADQLMDRTSTMVDQHLTSYLSIPHKVSQMNADVIEMGLLDVRARKTVGKYFWHQMQAYDLSYIGIGLTTGEGVGAAVTTAKPSRWMIGVPNLPRIGTAMLWISREIIPACLRYWIGTTLNNPIADGQVGSFCKIIFTISTVSFLRSGIIFI